MPSKQPAQEEEKGISLPHQKLKTLIQKHRNGKLQEERDRLIKYATEVTTTMFTDHFQDALETLMYRQPDGPYYVDFFLLGDEERLDEFIESRIPKLSRREMEMIKRDASRAFETILHEEGIHQGKDLCTGRVFLSLGGNCEDCVSGDLYQYFWAAKYFVKERQENLS